MNVPLAYLKIFAETKKSGITEVTLFYRTEKEGIKRRIDAEWDGESPEVQILSDRIATDSVYGKGIAS